MVIIANNLMISGFIKSPGIPESTLIANILFKKKLLFRKSVVHDMQRLTLFYFAVKLNKQ